MEFRDGKGRKIEVKMQASLSAIKIITVTFYCDLWIVNKTKLPLLFGPDSRDEITGGLSEVEGRMSKYQGIVNNNWFAEEYPLERHMYTASQGMFSATKIHLRIADSLWSEGVAIGAEGSQGEVVIKTAPHGLKEKPVVGCFPLAITVQAGPAQFWRTKKVIVTPRYSIWNNTSEVLFYMQKDTKNKCPPFELAASKFVPFYLTRDPKGPPIFRLSIGPEDWLWSGAIPLGMVSLLFVD